MTWDDARRVELAEDFKAEYFKAEDFRSEYFRSEEAFKCRLLAACFNCDSFKLGSSAALIARLSNEDAGLRYNGSSMYPLELIDGDAAFLITSFLIDPS